MSALDKAENAVEDAAGKAEEDLGTVRGDESTETEGKTGQFESDLANAGGNVREAFEN